MTNSLMFMNKDYAKFIVEKTTNDYNRIADDFSRTRSHVWEELRVLEKYIQPGDKVLDLGCGNGRFYEFLKNEAPRANARDNFSSFGGAKSAEAENWHSSPVLRPRFSAKEDKKIDYSGVDVSEKLIKIAKERYPEAKFQTADALNLPFSDNCFDKVLCVAVLHHIPSAGLRNQFLNEAIRVLRPNGLLILTVWNLWQSNTALKLLVKYTILKILGKSWLDFGDIFYPWKDGFRKELIQRYFHLFTEKELTGLISDQGFIVKEIGTLEDKKLRHSNIYIVGEKS